MMKRIRLSLSLICCMMGIVFAGCGEFHESPDPYLVTPPEKAGSLLAGETGSRFVTRDFRPFPETYYAWTGTTVYSLNLDPDSDVYLQIACTYSYNGLNTYSSASIGSPDSTMEFSIQDVPDTNWVCYDVNADTTEGSILYYNGLSGRQCSGQRYFENSYSVTVPAAYTTGMRIDANLPWKSGGLILGSSDLYFFAQGGFGHPSVSQQQTRNIWGAYTDTRFMAIRVRDGNRYRYGYVEMQAGTGHVAIHRTALER